MPGRVRCLGVVGERGMRWADAERTVGTIHCYSSASGPFQIRNYYFDCMVASTIVRRCGFESPWVADKHSWLRDCPGEGCTPRRRPG